MARSKSPASRSVARPPTPSLAARVDAYIHLFSQRVDVRIAARVTKPGRAKPPLLVGVPEDVEAFARERGKLTWTGLLGAPRFTMRA